MLYFDVILLALLFIVGTLAAYRDAKSGIVPNKLLGVFAILGLVVDAVYYGFYARDVLLLFLGNFLLTSLVALILFYTHSLAGGDSKLIIVMSLLYPTGMYLTYGTTEITLFVSVFLAIVFGYVFLVFKSLWQLIIGSNKVNKGELRVFLIDYLTSYFVAFVYVALINLICVVVSRFWISVQGWVVLLLCFCMAWASRKNKLMRMKGILCAVIALDVFGSIILKVIVISLSPFSYAITALLLLCQMVIRSDLYETISTVDIKKGMILSSASSLMMQNSRVPGLPKVSSEDLGARLTEEEAESVRKWSKTTKGMKQVVIVKKVPFALFISFGFLIYFVIWSVVA